MKLYRSFLFFTLGISLISLNSCTKYLDTQPFSFNTVDKLYTSKDGAELGLTGCYNTLNAQSVQGQAWGGSFIVAMPMMFNGGTDEVVTRDGFTDPNWAPFGNHTYTSQTPSLRSNWFILFAGINRTSYLLEKIDALTMDETRKAEMKGEAHFLRGLFYFYLSQAYGGLPIYTTSVQDPKVQREPVQKVYDQIIADFTAAYQTLPNRAGISGRANKWSAAGYLAKVYTYLASSKTNNVGEDLKFPLNSFAWVKANDMYSKAKTVTDDIIANSGLKLTKHYDYLFRETTGQWQQEESLFSLMGSKSASNGNYNLLLFWQIPVGAPTAGGGYGWYRPTGELFNKYASVDIRRSHNLTQAVYTTSKLENIEGVNYYIPDSLPDPKQYNMCVGKYRYRDASVKQISNAWSDGDIVLLRYADILLLNAEATYFTGDETAARARLRQVLARVASDGTQLDALSTAYHNQDFVSELLDSRARELCFEGWRRIDLIRFGKMTEVINSLSADKGVWNSIVPQIQANWTPSKIWFPIPQSEIELSPLVQNPGYN